MTLERLQPTLDHLLKSRRSKRLVQKAHGGFTIRISILKLAAAISLLVAALPGLHASISDSRPEKTHVTDGLVQAIARHGDTIYIGGRFTRIGPRTGPGVEFALDGTQKAGLPEVTGSNGIIQAVAPDGSGGWYIAGQFTHVGGLPRSNIAHIRADYTVDPTFAPNANDRIQAMAVSGSTVYVAGLFTSIGGVTRNRIAALDASTGAATAFDPNADAAVEALVVSGSIVYAGGRFTTIGGLPRTSIAALNAADGTAVPSFNPATDGIVTAMAISGQTLYVGGSFRTMGGQPRSNIAALNAGGPLDGTIVPTFNPTATAGGGAVPSGAGGVSSLAVSPSGSTVYAGGLFTSIGGQNRRYFGALNAADGTATPFNPNPNGNILGISVSADGSTVYAAGSFNSFFDGLPSIGGKIRNYIAALNASDGTATAFDPSPPNGVVLSVGISTSSVYAGGAFSSIGGVTRNGIAAIRASDGTPTDFNPNVKFGANHATVYSLAVSGNTVYAGGFFNSVGGQARNFIAAINADDGLPTAWNPGANSTVEALTVSGSIIYAGGSFTTIGSQPRNFIAALALADGIPTSFNPSANGPVQTIAVAGPLVYTGGFFTSIGGQTRNKIAALRAVDGTATSWDPDATPLANVLDLAVAGDTIYAGGNFSTLGGQPRRNIAAVRASDGRATDFDPQANEGVFALALSGSTVYAGGFFSNIGGHTRHLIAELNPLTGNATAFDPGADPGFGIFALVVAPDGTLHAGGSMRTFDLAYQQGFVSFADPAPVARLTASPSSGAAPLTVDFDASASSDPDPGDHITGFTMNFGDGTPPETKTTPLFRHTYTDAGQFTARLTVTDGRGDDSLTAAAVSIDVTAGSGLTVPAPPIIGIATTGDGEATIGFAPPVTDGGSPITSYTVSCSPGPIVASGTFSPITVSGLANGATYLCSVTATNAAGASASSEVVSVTPALSSDWSIRISPNRMGEDLVDFLSQVECVSSTDCWAVGNYSAGRYTGGVDIKTLAMHWDGTAWSVVSSPNISEVRNNYLSDVTCVSTSDCWAVGYYGNPASGSRMQTLVAHWNGTAWSIVSSPNTDVHSDNVLYGVTCTSAGNCWAAGYYSTPSGAQTMMQRWDGNSWTIVPSPNGEQLPVGGSPWGASALYDVTCTSASNCWAVGNFFNGLSDQPLTLRWDGIAWAIVSSTSVNPATNHYLYGVTCVTASDCWSVGVITREMATETLIMHWDGSAWLPSVSQNSPGSNGLYSVTCNGSADCWAVGGTDVAGSIGQILAGLASQTLIQHWDGTRWSIVASPNTSTSQPNVVSGVTCSSTLDCWAVGFAGGGAFVSLTERWNGTAWSIVPSPNARQKALHVLSDVTCVTASDCWAVGNDLAGNAMQHHLQHWNGTSWSIVTAPTRSKDHDHQLLGVTCLSASDCWSVGYELTTGVAWQNLIQHWNGTTWSIVSAPNTSASQHNVLSDVTCLSASDCWAVGHFATGFSANGYLWQTLIEHWDGSAWTIVTTPNTSASQANVLSSVSCVSPTDCWAAGKAFNGTVDQTLLLRWNGASWAIVNSPNTSPSASNALASVTCLSPAECWAVGSYTGTSAQQTLIAHWNGIGWNIIASPNTGAALDNQLTGVTCVSGSECWAVGSSANGQVLQSLIARWNGAVWSRVHSPNSSDARNNTLTSVACPSASSCWAVGSFDSGLIAQTLVQQYTARPAQNLPPVARLAADSMAGHAPLTVTFDASASSDPNPGDSVTLFTISFGDGSPSETRSSPFLSHTYQQPGLYRAELFVTDSHGRQSAAPAVVLIEVLSTTPVIPAVSSIDVTPGCEGSALTVTLIGTNFESGAMVQVNGTNRGPDSIGPTQLTFTIVPGDLDATRTFAVRVVNPGASLSNVVVVMIPRPGDLNLDAGVDAQDLVILANYLVDNVTAGAPPFTAQLGAADLNRDAVVNAVDIVIHANYMVGNITCLTVD